MAFPATPLPIKAEMLLAGIWTDVTSYVRGVGGIGGIVINRGYSGEQASQSPGTCAFTLDNTDNRFNNRNPTGPYYRQLGRNTQFRTSVDTGVVSARFLDTMTTTSNTYDGATIWTADKAVLDIVGDIDVSIDVDADDWRGRRGQIFASKYLRAGNQRSWSFNINPDGYLFFVWSTDGTSTGNIIAQCPTPIWPTGRISLRAILDVDNGGGGWTCSFYQSTTLGGTYTFINSATGTGTTSVFSSSARVEVGTADLGATWQAVFSASVGDADPFVGRMYGFRLKNGINGTNVAIMDATTQTAGTTTWSDATPFGLTNTWTVTNSCYLSSVDYRFWGEMPSMPRAADTSVTDLTVGVRAVDIISRLTQGTANKPLESSVKRNFKQYAWDGYWPMEQDTSSTAPTAYVGQQGYLTKGGFSGQSTDFPGSAGSLAFNDDQGYASGNDVTTTGTPTVVSVICYFKFDTPPVSATTYPFMNWYFAGGNGYRLTYGINNASFTFQVIDVYGNSLVSLPVAYGSGVSPGSWLAMRVKMSSSGGTITVEAGWYPIGTPGVFFGTSGTYSGTMGRPSSWISWPFPGKLGLEIAHVAMGRFDLPWVTADFVNSTNAYDGEKWDDRARRLSLAQGVPIFLRETAIRDGSDSWNLTMGPQGLKTYFALMQDCANVAAGDLYAPRDKFGLMIAAREVESNQIGGSQLKLDYSLKQLSGQILPEPDDFLIENDVTLSTSDGNQFRYAKADGTLNTTDPQLDPNGVGVYDVVDSSPVTTTTDLETMTRRRVLFGTWDEDRYPQVQVNLERSEFTASAALTAPARKLDLTRGFSIVNPGSWLAVDQIDLMTVGYVETLGQFQQQIAVNTRPYGPYNSGIWGSSSFATTSLWGAKSSTLNAGYSNSAVTIVVTTNDVYEQWNPFAGNFDIMVAGERMTVTAAGARAGTGPYTYSLTVTRSVNGVVKAQLAGETVAAVNTGRWV
jgi:hypothetical protein